MTISIRQLQYFVIVAEELHFRRAAERLFLSQPALSHQIARLEREVGVRLLDRDRHGVELTEAGSALLEGARRTLTQAERSVASARWAGGITSHGLRVGYPSYSRGIVRRTLEAFAARHPEVWIDERDMHTTSQVRALLEQSLDIGFVRPPVTADIAVEVLLPEELVVILPMAHQLAGQPRVPMRALSGERILLPASGAMAWYNGHIKARCQLAGFKPQVARMRSSQPFDLKTLLPLVEEGEGVGLITSSAPRTVSARVVFRPVSESTPGVKLAVAWLRRAPPPLLARFLDVARETSRLF